MRPGWFASPFMHAVGVLAMIVVWPREVPELNVESAIVPVDVVADISEITNISAVAPPAPTAPEPTPEKAGAPQPEAAEAAEETAEAIPSEKPPPKKPEKESKRVNLDDIALLLDRSKKEKGRTEETTAPEAAPGEKPRKGFGAADGLTMTELDALRAQLAKCWRAPVDAPNPERLVVKVKITLAKSGALSSAPELVSPRVLAGADPALKVAAENAVRAVQLCAPYELPADRYARWREITFTFDPREMLQ